MCRYVWDSLNVLRPDWLPASIHVDLLEFLLCYAPLLECLGGGQPQAHKSHTVVLNHDGGEHNVNRGSILGVEPLLVDAPVIQSF